MTRAWLITLAACDGSAPPKPAPPKPAPIAAPVAIDAALPDAAIPLCPTDATVHKFRFGTLSVPGGWCWQRSGEGDDQSGTVFDDKHHVQLTFTQLSFDENVGDACAGKPARDVRVGAARYMCGDPAVLASVLTTLVAGTR